MHRIFIITPFYNAEKFIEECMDSVLEQNYEGEVYHGFCNDCSTDNSEYKIKKKLEAGYKYKYFYGKSPMRYGPMISHLNCMHNIKTNPELYTKINPSDIVIHLDGDDKLAHPNVLSRISEIYEDENIWGTYGSYKSTDGSPCVARAVEGEGVREWIAKGWPFSHLRTFRAELFYKIPAEYFKDSQGQWLSSAADTAIMCGVFELCGLDRVKFLDEVLYTYRVHEGCEHKDHVGDQVRCAIETSKKTPLKRLDHANFFIVSTPAVSQ